ncbi:MAG: Nif3-like dinuclear metal center hexameric protein [Gammaproteobacteria bacterium]|nr:Nif3-like dinuclear metal center hexameric protein [Gammaproteobacteria bacterium]
MSNKQLQTLLNQLLSSDKIKDYCPNGLQVEGKTEINKIVTGVTASEALIDAAIDVQADAILVHHGYFWKGENQTITGLKKNRIGKLIKHDINLFAYHLPIDVHPELGNNAQLASLLGITNIEAIDQVSPLGVLMRGEFEQALTATQLTASITSTLHRAPLVSDARKQAIKTVAWCTGGGQGYIDTAAELGIDAFITGEASEQTIHSSREHGIDFFAAGHHATERYGVKAVGEYLQQNHGLDVEFIDIPNPV